MAGQIEQDRTGTIGVGPESGTPPCENARPGATDAARHRTQPGTGRNQALEKRLSRTVFASSHRTAVVLSFR